MHRHRSILHNCLKCIVSYCTLWTSTKPVDIISMHCIIIINGGNWTHLPSFCAVLTSPLLGAKYVKSLPNLRISRLQWSVTVSVFDCALCSPVQILGFHFRNWNHLIKIVQNMATCENYIYVDQMLPLHDSKRPDGEKCSSRRTRLAPPPPSHNLETWLAAATPRGFRALIQRCFGGPASLSVL